MKIAFYNLTTTTKAGGLETFNWEIAKALALRGHIVHIYGGKGQFLQTTNESLKVFCYPYLRRELIPNLGTRFRKFTERLSFGFFAIKDLIKHKYDYIYLSKPYDIPVALLASKFNNAKIIYGSGGTEFFPGYKYLVKRLDYFFACSKYNAKQIEEYCGIKPLVLYNGVNTEIFKPLKPDISLKSELNIKDNEIIIISACRLVGWKGIQYAIKAIFKLHKIGYNLKYLIIGDGQYRPQLEKLVRKINANEYIIFLGKKKNHELPRYYSISDIAVFPSIADETFGISIAEAMACGVPVISTRVGGIPEVVPKGTGILIMPEKEDSIAVEIEKLIKNKCLKESIAMKGRRWIAENFDWNCIVKRFEEFLS